MLRALKLSGTLFSLSPLAEHAKAWIANNREGLYHQFGKWAFRVPTLVGLFAVKNPD